MKKTILVLIMIISIGCFAFAEDGGPIRGDFTMGAYYNAEPLSGSDSIAVNIWESLFNFHAGVLAGLGYNITDDMTVGAELGILAGVSVTIGDYYIADIDLPLNAFYEFRYEDFAVKGYAGGMFLALVGNELTLEGGIDLGARLSWMGFYIEGGYVFQPALLIGEIEYSMNHYPRFGLGYTMGL